MARNRNAINPVRAAAMRKWYARAWWIGIHVYGYVVLGVQGVLSPEKMPIAQFVLYLIVAVATIGCYIALQNSSPGQLEKRLMLDPVPTITPTDFDSPVQVPGKDGVDTELLTNFTENEHLKNSTDLHFCNECHIFQPLRTKHCKDCARCTRQYDHHCDCAGTCVGENNRHLFVFYLFLQIVEGTLTIEATSSVISEGDDITDWLQINALYIVLWFITICVLLIVVPLFCYQLFLISKNLTSWEHARRSSITYLQNLPDTRSPFDRGFFQNWYVFISNGDRNKWVHQIVANPMTSYRDDDVV